MRFILIRHGQSQANAGQSKDHDSALTDFGHSQAKTTAKFVADLLGGSNGCLGFVSPFLRAIETAAPLHKATGIPFSLAWNIREIEHSVPPETSIAIPKQREGFEWVHGEESGQWSYAKETREQFLERIAGFLAAFQTPAYRGIETIVLVSHGMPTLAMAETLLTGKVAWPDTWHEQYPNASVTDIQDGQSQLLIRIF